MKKTISFLILLLVIINLTGCSSIKVSDVWKSEQFEAIKDNKVLVIARTDNTQARLAFEGELKEQLEKNGVKATASATTLPTKIKIEKELSQDQKMAFRDFLKNEAYDGVVLSVIKDVKETTRTVTEGGYYAGATLPRYYPYYYTGFFSYYYNPLSYSSFGTYVEPSSTTYSYKTYIVETVVYDLNQKEGEQLLAVITASIEDPYDLDKFAKTYAKKLVKSLK